MQVTIAEQLYPKKDIHIFIKDIGRKSQRQSLGLSELIRN